MFYNEIINELMQDKKNPVNSMYLHEINIKWKNFEKFIEEKKGSNKEMLAALNNFISNISNPKYIYNPSTRNGFKADSPIFSSRYLDDMISIIMKRNKIIENKGIIWGFQNFSTNLKFNPQNLSSLEKNPMFEQDYTEKVLSLTQKMDFQFRVSGKRNFHKYEIIFPLIIFNTFKNLTEEDFIKVEYTSALAKGCFERSKSIIICETLDRKFIPSLKSSAVDDIFILRKQFKSSKLSDLSLEVINALEEHINEYISQTEKKDETFLNTGVIH